jgi:hypothetical protein
MGYLQRDKETKCGIHLYYIAILILHKCKTRNFCISILTISNCFGFLTNFEQNEKNGSNSILNFTFCA